MKRFPRRSTGPVLSLGLGLVSLAPPPASAQFGRTFSSPDVTRPTLNEVYQYAGGPLVVLLETDPAREDAYLFVDAATGALGSAFRLDARHGAMPSPDGREIRIAGTEQTPALDPVYFAGRYDAATLAPIGERQMAVDKNSGYVLTGEVAPDGTFVFRGAHSGRSVNLLGRYSAEFEPLWGLEVTYRSRFEGLGMEAYPLGGGDVGFLVSHPILAGDALTRWNVFGLVGGGNGTLTWSTMIATTQSGLEQDDLRPVFGSDGTFHASLRRLNLLQPATDTVGLLRLGKDGHVIYNRTLKVPGATVEGTYYFGDATLVYLTYKEGTADRIQCVVIDAAGAVSQNVALQCQLRGGGAPKLSATRREGTDFVFLRFEAGFTTISPQLTLARLDLKSGEMLFRRLPSGVAMGPYEVVTTPPGDYLSPFNNVPGLPARGTSLSGVLTHPVSGPGILALYELPSSGAFPTCVSLTDSAVTTGSPLPIQWTDTASIPLAEGATVAAHAMPGMVAAALKPDLRPLTVTATTVCEDDLPASPVVSIGIARVGDREVELRVPTVAGYRYRLHVSDDLARWTEVGTKDGDGSAWVTPRAASRGREFLRASVESVAIGP